MSFGCMLKGMFFCPKEPMEKMGYIIEKLHEFCKCAFFDKNSKANFKNSSLSIDNRDKRLYNDAAQ